MSITERLHGRTRRRLDALAPRLTGRGCYSVHWTKPLAVATACLTLPAPASAQAPAAVTIDVDATTAGDELKRVWAYYGYDEVNYTTTTEGEDLLRTLVAINSAPVYTRTHFLFNTGDGTPGLKWGSTNIYTEDTTGNPVFDYTLIDQVMDTTLNAGAFPLVELAFMPEALSSRPTPYENSSPYVLDGGAFYPPNDYEKWATLVREWALHVKQRYPDAETTWQWELWNEPDIAYWRGSFEQFATLYDHTEAALHSVFPDASLGGPAVVSPNTGFLQQFLDHCATGTNAVSGETGTRLDMVSFHGKGGVTTQGLDVQMDLGNQLRLHRSGFEMIAASAFARKPIVISEADPDGCAACPVATVPSNAYRLSPAYGAYAVAMMKRSLELADASGVDLRGVLTWAFTFPGSPYFAGYRALATNGIHLPVLNAFKLLGSLNGNRLPVSSNGALALTDIVESGVRQQPDIDALASIDGDRIQILAWNYHDDLVQVAPTPVSLSVALPARFGREAIITHTRVDDSNGNAHAVWVAQGKPATPSAEQVTALEQAMQPVVLEAGRAVPVANGMLSVSFELPRFGLSLVTVTASDQPASTVSGTGGSGCGCALTSPARLPMSAFAILALLTASIARRRLEHGSSALPQLGANHPTRHRSSPRSAGGR